ncbi:hypothetical protein [Sphingobacterium spiritivorum]|uniref:hypothetical protein n=1 Tax=Sphingobacterium spiritivorum TaxID=258 RepID=UPI00191866D5|nr:hypothetical protein [Sphingobacterium spiritivorum]QQT28171.1 hypothetical protein I6J02_10150 [Sphingobacterium spiritivorum]
MKRKNYLLSCTFTFVVFAIIAFTVACQKSNDPFAGLSESEELVISKKAANSTFKGCLETYDLWQWSVSYACPQNHVELELNKLDIKRAKRIDSIIKANSFKYPTTTPVQVNPDTGTPSYLIPLMKYGTATTSMIDEVAGTPEMGGSTITLYVLEYGPYGGVISLGIESSGYNRAVAFYPNTNSVMKYTNYPGVFTNTGGLAYTYSISKTASFLGPFLNYLTNRQTPWVNHSYSYGSFEGYHLFKEAVSKIGLQLPVIATGGDFAHNLAQSIRTWNPPAGVTVNKEGGIIPMRQGTGGDGPL